MGEDSREQAGIIVEINKSEVINKRQMGKQIQRGRQKSKNQTRVSQQYLNNLAYRNLGTEHDQYSDSQLVHRLRYIYTQV